MHACGMMHIPRHYLGRKRFENELRTNFEGTNQVIFQPGEEVAPGELLFMMNRCLWWDNIPDAPRIIGQHVMHFIPLVKLGFD